MSYLKEQFRDISYCECAECLVSCYGRFNISAAIRKYIDAFGPISLPIFHRNSNSMDISSLHWRHNDHDGVSNHQPRGCLLNRLFRRISKKTSKLRVTGLCAGNSPGPVNSTPKGPVTRKMFSFDDVIMFSSNSVSDHPLASRFLDVPQQRGCRVKCKTL